MMHLAQIKEAILAASKSPNIPIKLIAIDGQGGSGKSTLAEKLAVELGAEVLRTDDFGSWDNTVEWTQKFFDSVIEPLKAGTQSLSYDRGSWGVDHHPEPVVSQPVTDIMILEGIRSARKELREFLSFAIWVETTKEVCFKRGLERDGQDALEQWKKWWDEAEAYIANDQPQVFANIAVDGNS